MRKRFFIVLLAILFSLPCFAERKTRVDKYENLQVKIIWNSRYTTGPNDSNWAKTMGISGWESGLNYIYIINPKNTADNSDSVRIGFYTYKDGREYKYYVLIEKNREGIIEKIAENYYYSYEYNLAKSDFDKWAKIYELNISLDGK